MKFFVKFIIFSFLIVVARARFIGQEVNLSNTTDDQPENECNCNWRFLKHYEIKGCILEQVNSCGCPKTFSCPQNQTLQIPDKVCVYQNKEWPVGSKILTSNTCQFCRCRDGEPPYMSCVHKDCQQVELSIGADCHFVYEENRCCPVAHECLTSESEGEIPSNETCEYNGKYYPFGSKIFPVDDPCQICICNENWNGIDNTSCYQHECVLERSKSKLDMGCIPVYHESRCCPIEFYCPSIHKFSYSLLSNNESEINETSDDQCSFGDQPYEIGTQLFMDDPCVICHCQVPPVFTCIHQACPPSPNLESCYPLHKKEECCPSFECLYGDAEPESSSDGCPTPLCAHSSCRVETPPGHECPTCVCGERFSELEHNEVQQQVQQISQGVDNQVDEGPIETADYDYSVDQLQMMPIRIQDAEGEFTITERILLPESEKIQQNPEEDIRELEDSSRESNSSAEMVPATSEEVLEEQNPESISESELDDSDTGTQTNLTEKEIHKRSNGGQVSVLQQQEQTFGQIPHNYETIEREGGTLETDGDFEDELESFKKKIFEKNGTIINEIISINHEVEVPPGCPTPLCEGSWCKVGIPSGHKCPTCICKCRVGNEP